MLPVYEAGVQYLRPAKYDDVLEIRWWSPTPGSRSGSSTRCTSPVVTNDGAGHTVHVCVGRDGKPTRAPDWLLQALEGVKHG